MFVCLIFLLWDEKVAIILIHDILLLLLKILEKRHAQEMKDLDKTFQEERRVGIDESLAKLEEKHVLQMDELRKTHSEELNKLEGENLPSEEYHQRKAQLLNRQQLQLSSLERKHQEELKKLKTSATADWEVRYARAKLELKEKHYEVRDILISVVYCWIAFSLISKAFESPSRLRLIDESLTFVLQILKYFCTVAVYTRESNFNIQRIFTVRCQILCHHKVNLL